MSNEIKNNVWLLHKGRKFLHAFSAATSVISVVDYALGLGVLKKIVEQYPIAGYIAFMIILGIGVFKFEALIEGIVSMFADFLNGNLKNVKIRFTDHVLAIGLVLVLVGASSYTSFYGMQSATTKYSDLDPEIASLKQTEKEKSAYRQQLKAQYEAAAKGLEGAEKLEYERNAYSEMKEALADKQTVFDLQKNYTQMRVSSTAGMSFALGLIAFIAAIAAGIMAYFQSKLAVSINRSVESIVQSEKQSRSTTRRIRASIKSMMPKNHEHQQNSTQKKKQSPSSSGTVMATEIEELEAALRAKQSARSSEEARRAALKVAQAEAAARNAGYNFHVNGQKVNVV